MTVKEVSCATGVSLQTVYAHLHSGDLAGEWTGSRWEIPAGEVVDWARWMWQLGRCLQFPPDYTMGFIKNFNLN